MRVAIVGSGGIARGYAALLQSRGHEPVLWSPSGAAQRDFGASASLTATGKIEATMPLSIAAACAEAASSAKVIIVAVQANGFRATLDELAGCLRDDHVVIISAHCSFAALYLHQLLARRGIAIPIAAWATTALTARKSGPKSVHISGLRNKLDVATLPRARAADALSVCCELFGDRFEEREDVLAIMLSNLNPPAHMANMLGNLTRAEKGEDWSNYGSITESVGRIIQALDAERLALAAAFGLKVRTIQDHYALSFDVARGPVSEMSAAVNAKRKPELLGPKSLDTRFITEDTPFGLVPLEKLGALIGSPTPLHSAGIELFNAICARDFRKENDLLPRLGLDGLDGRQLHRLLQDGS
jgi:opine dehydrogenase